MVQPDIVFAKNTFVNKISIFEPKLVIFMSSKKAFTIVAKIVNAVFTVFGV